MIDKHYNGKDKASSQLYKQAGNSIVVQVLEAVFSQIKGIETEW
ncbi:MAG: DNA cytosine methyltransferase [Prevotella sp.]|nr:DNA cytosine methyltransferase [Prevotella sp.]